MKDQVVMSPNNGALCVAVPLFRYNYSDELEKLPGVSIALVNEKPLMYALDIGDDKLQAFDAEWIENNLEFLGEL